ncbi:MAG: hypothetical protein KAJ51_05140, partial [Thermoplasmata archaeon]|nr:hypothetical protein [Thermoplasmata archaeon]
MMGPNLDLSGNPEDFETPDIPFSESIIENARRLLTNPPPAFTVNRGQLENGEVRFYVQGGGIWFTDDGVWIELREYADTRGQGSH